MVPPPAAAKLVAAARTFSGGSGGTTTAPKIFTAAYKTAAALHISFNAEILSTSR